MSVQFVGLKEINGPLVVLDHVREASFEEMVTLELEDGTTRDGRIVSLEGEKAVIQVFEGTSGLSLTNTRTRLLGHPMEMALSPEVLGRVFNGSGKPIDGLGGGVRRGSPGYQRPAHQPRLPNLPPATISAPASPPSMP